MGDCDNCSAVNPLRDSGIVLLAGSGPEIVERLKKIAGKTVGSSSKTAAGELYGIAYGDKEQLFGVLDMLFESFAEPDRPFVRIGFREEGKIDRTGMTLKQLGSRMEHQDLVDVIREAKFASFMQPIICTADQRVFGYEFLLRPAEGAAAFRPFELFGAAQETGLHSFLDRAARLSAISASAVHLKRGLKRFVNFLPSSIYNPNYCLSHTFREIGRLALDPQDFVFEVVETEHVTDVRHLQSIFDAYKTSGMKVALDDVGAGYSTLDMIAKLQPDYVKFDRALTARCDTDRNKQRKINDILQVAVDYGAIVLAEGIERREELDYCRSVGIPLAQGYLLGKPGPEPLDKTFVTIDK